MVIETINLGKTIFFMGNGVSTAESQHIFAEFVERFLRDRQPISAISLNSDTSSMTAISNDYKFDDIFVRQL